MLVTDDHLLVGVVELDGELRREYGFWGRRNPAILADCFLGQGGLSPFRYYEDLPEENVWYIRIVQGDCITVLERGVGWVGMAQGVCGLGLVAVLAEV